MPFTLAHLSDVHLAPLPETRGLRLGAKQMAGRFNLSRGRGLDARVLAAVLADLERASVDHIAVTGDLINIGLEAEVQAAAAWLAALGPPDRVSLVPGNHDAYVPSARTSHLTAWAAYMTGDTGGGGAEPGAATFPYVRRRGDVALIGLSTAVPTPIFMATGRLGVRQLEGVGKALDETRGLCRVVMIHHPPDRGTTRWHRRLVDAAALRKVLAAHGAELVLRGHNHRNTVAAVDGPNGDIPVLAVAATAQLPDAHHPGGSWIRVAIERTGAGFHIETTTRSFALPNTMEDAGTASFDLPAG